MGRRLDPDEAILWRRIAATVKPLSTKVAPPVVPGVVPTPPRAAVPPPRRDAPALAPRPGKAEAPRPRRTPHQQARLDSHWDRRLRKGLVRPEMSIDLHGHSLASAQALLDETIGHALLRGARLLLVVAGRLRPENDRVSQLQGLPRPRGAIRASLPDWLAASPHADAIIAIRPAHISHGGAGALYVILRRSRQA